MRSLIITFHDVTYFLIIVFVFVSWILLQLMLNFTWKPLDYYYDSFYYLNSRLIPYNNSFLEFMWTIFPILIFFLVFIPLLKLLRVLGFEDTFIKHKTINDHGLRHEYISNIYTNIMSLEKLSNIYTEFKVNTSKMFSEWNDLYFTIKVIGNQWYWMYESTTDYGLGELANVDSYFEDEVISSYMSSDNFYIDWKSEGNADYKMSKYIRLLSADYFLTVKSDYWVSFFITSYDVIHCWVLPSAGIKIDACPGRISSSKVIFKEKGFFYGQCSELCGFLHGFMPISIRIV